MNAKDIMTKNVISVSVDEPVDNIIKILVDNDISGIPVVDDANKVKGIISEGDLIYKTKDIHLPLYFSILDANIFLENTNIIKKQLEKMAASDAKSMMTSKVICAKEDDSIKTLSTIMSENNVNRIPIVDEDNVLKGIVTRKDIIKSYMTNSDK